MVFTVKSGFSEKEVAEMSPSSFKVTYQSLKRLEAQEKLTELYLVNQASNGTKDSLKSFSDGLSVWLPDEKTTSTDKSSLISFMGKKGKK